MCTEFVPVLRRKLLQGLRITEGQLNHQLRQLAFLDLIDYVPKYEGLLVRLMVPRQQPEAITIDVQKWQARKQAELDRIDFLRKYAEDRLECRQAYIIRYFDQDNQHTVCGICDNCQRNAKHAETAHNLEQQILGLLNQPITGPDIVAGLVKYSEDEVWTVLRHLLDNNTITRSEQGYFEVSA